MSEWQTPEGPAPVRGRSRRTAIVVGLSLVSMAVAFVYLLYGSVKAHVVRCRDAQVAVAEIVALQQRPMEELPTLQVQIDQMQAPYRRLVEVAESVDADALVTDDARAAWAALRASAKAMLTALEVRRGPSASIALIVQVGRLRDGCRATPGCDVEKVQSALYGDRDVSSAALVARARAGLAIVEGVEALHALRVATSTHADELESREADEAAALEHFRAAFGAVESKCRDG